jgi:hypothetical protein
MLGDAFKRSAGRFGVDVDKLLSGSQSGGDRPSGENMNSLSRALIGTPGTLGDFYFPSELIGGCCPHIPGEEEEIVWNAAAESCDSERIHVAWQVSGSHIWYLAIRSSELGSHPGSWCPFSSLLPGMKDATPSPVCYTYYSDEAATMMTVAPDGLQIYRGMSSVVRAKAERTSRELNNAPIIELNPDQILKLTPVPWYSMSLFEDRARRIFAAVAVATAIGVTALAFVIWLLTTMVIITNRASLDEARARTAAKTMDLMRQVGDLRTSPMREQLAHFADTNDGLLAINGFLDVYEIKDGKTRWHATVPPNVTADRINELGGKTIDTTPDGVGIGNANEIEYEATVRKK